MSEKQNEAWWLAQDLILLTQEGQFTGSTTEKLLRQVSVLALLHHKKTLTEAFLFIFNSTRRINSNFPLVRTIQLLLLYCF